MLCNSRSDAASSSGFGSEVSGGRPLVLRSPFRRREPRRIARTVFPTKSHTTGWSRSQPWAGALHARCRLQERQNRLSELLNAVGVLDIERWLLRFRLRVDHDRCPDETVPVDLQSKPLRSHHAPVAAQDDLNVLEPVRGCRNARGLQLKRNAGLLQLIVQVGNGLLELWPHNHPVGSGPCLGVLPLGLL